MAILSQRVDLILLVAPQIEFDSAVALLEGRRERRIDAVSVQIGTLYRYRVAVVRCKPGSSGRDASQAVLSAVLPVLRPLAVIAVGIAFGARRNKQQFETVMISTQIIPYELQRVGETETRFRAPRPESGMVLQDRMSALVFEGKIGGVAVEFGPLVTGEKLLDNKEMTAALFEEFPDAIGGEMEGAGVYAAASRVGIEWLIIKAIVDFADGTKTDKHQSPGAEKAMKVVAALCSTDGLDRKHFQRGYAERVWPFRLAWAATLVLAVMLVVALGSLRSAHALTMREATCLLGHKPSCRLELDDDIRRCRGDRDADACLRAALLLKDHRAMPRSGDPQIEDLLTSGCTLKNAASCYSAGILRRQRVLPNPEMAGANFEAGCALGHGMACHEQSKLLPPGLQRSELMMRSCDLGASDACADIVVDKFSSDGGSLRIQREGFEAPCRQGSDAACLNLAVMLSQERDEQDQKRAREFFVPLCDNGYGRACTKIGDQYRNGEAGLIRDVARARSFYELGCERGDFAGCVERAYLADDGSRLKISDVCLMNETTVRFLEKACSLNDTQACNDVGWFRLGEALPAPNLDEAYALLTNACSAGESMACWNLGWMYVTGRGVKADRLQAISLMDRACKQRLAPACHDLGVALLMGPPSTADSDRALTSFLAACALGFTKSCSAARVVDAGVVPNSCTW